MSDLFRYIQSQNAMNAVFRPGSKQYDFNNLSKADVAELLDRLEGDLSPENLSCDGELRGQALITKSRYLNAVKAELETLK